MVPPIVAGLLWRFLMADQIGIMNHALVAVGILRAPTRSPG